MVFSVPGALAVAVIALFVSAMGVWRESIASTGTIHIFSWLLVGFLAGLLFPVIQTWVEYNRRTHDL